MSYSTFRGFLKERFGNLKFDNVTIKDPKNKESDQGDMSSNKTEVISRNEYSIKSEVM